MANRFDVGQYDIRQFTDMFLVTLRRWAKKRCTSPSSWKIPVWQNMIKQVAYMGLRSANSTCPSLLKADRECIWVISEPDYIFCWSFHFSCVSSKIIKEDLLTLWKKKRIVTLMKYLCLGNLPRHKTQDHSKNVPINSGLLPQFLLFIFFFPKLEANSSRSEPTSFTVLLLQTAAVLQSEKLRCCALFCLHQTHPSSNVKLFKRGVIYSCPAQFDVRRCNDTKGGGGGGGVLVVRRGAQALQAWTLLPTTSSDMYLSSTKSNGNWQYTPASSVFSFITNFCVYSNPPLAVPLVKINTSGHYFSSVLFGLCACRLEWRKPANTD